MKNNRLLQLKVAPALSVLCTLLGYAALSLLPLPALTKTKAADRSQTALEPRTFLPLVAKPPLPPETELGVYGFDGTTEHGWDWLAETFGGVVLERGSGTASIRVLRAIEGPSTLTIWVQDAEGNPRENVPVVFHWPDAPELKPEEVACGLTRGVVGWTKSTGEVGFGMGFGAYYFPPDGGPHTVWVAVDGTDCLQGMGMLGGTNHQHLDSVWVVP